MEKPEDPPAISMNTKRPSALRSLTGDTPSAKRNKDDCQKLYFSSIAHISKITVNNKIHRLQQGIKRKQQHVRDIVILC